MSTDQTQQGFRFRAPTHENCDCCPECQEQSQAPSNIDVMSALDFTQRVVIGILDPNDRRRFAENGDSPRLVAQHVVDVLRGRGPVSRADQVAIDVLRSGSADRFIAGLLGYA